MNLTIRSVQPEDFPSVLAIQNETASVPMTFEQFLEREATRSKSEVFLERLMVWRNQIPVGLMSLVKHGFVRPDWAQINFVVAKEFRQQGVAKAMWQDLQQRLPKHHLAGVEVHVPDSNPFTRALAEAQGFEFYGHRFASELELHSFDAARFEAEQEKPAKHGIRIESFANILDWQQLYSFFAKSLARAPDMEGFPLWSLEQVKETFDHPNASPDWIWIAIQNGQWCGITVMLRHRGETYNFLTSVEPETRGTGTALALKLEAIQTAQQAGFRWMRTNNLSVNAPMLVINQKLGFQAKPGLWLMRLESSVKP